MFMHAVAKIYVRSYTYVYCSENYIRTYVCSQSQVKFCHGHALLMDSVNVVELECKQAAGYS